MLEQLILKNYPSGYQHSLTQDSPFFVLKTCQRTLLVGMKDKFQLYSTSLNDPAKTFSGPSAYTFLLEVICGLQSKLLGENEIVNQFKLAYQEYSQSQLKCNNTLLILEKLFRDAKNIRTKYLIGLGQKTYSSITRKHILQKNKANEVLILGSGQLAQDLINQFKKKTNVYLAARNPNKAHTLSQEHGINLIPWRDFEAFSSFAFIANSIGSEQGAFLLDDFFEQWNDKHERKLFVDLGSPSVIQTALTSDDGVLRLNDILDEGAMHQSFKKTKLIQAKEALDEVVKRRAHFFQAKLQNKLIYSGT
ncbi:MAG: NAD(P)-binding domain-containing protein [Bacteriovoracaceae bacterium]|nr:hypothetical protein [Halobacteriovoraceae bacterium]MDP7320442.1 NAD(P)-binding domain-containing protein [Bacteriovoracaceae bacterium]